MPGWIDAERPDRDGEWLLTHPAVDAFAQQVGVPGMTGVLLDHVHQHLTQADHLTVPVAPGHLKVRRLLDEALSETPLPPPGGPGGRDRRWVGDGLVERGVLVVVAPEQPRGVLAVEDTAQPVTLDVRQTANQIG